MTRRFAIHGILVACLAFGGCDGNTIAPTPPAAPTNPAGPAAPIIGVRVEGRVLNGDHESPVAGAIVRADRIWSAILQTNVTATTDDQGRFSLTAEVSSGWRELGMSVTRDGFEPGLAWVFPADLTVDLRLVPLLLIRPGETIEIGVFSNSTIPCFVESAVCFRVILEAPPGEAVDLEVTPMVEGERVLLAGPLASQPYSIDEIGTRVTASRGEVYVVPMSAVRTGVQSLWKQRVSLTAQRHGTGEKP